MNSRKLTGLFLKTLFIGGIVNLIASFFVASDIYKGYLQPVDLFELSGVAAGYILYGLLFSVISQAGFFAYLFINQFGLGLFRSFWPTVQVLLIAFTLFDLVYFPYKGADGDISLYLLLLAVLGLLIYGLMISRIKARATHKRAFIPSLFLMVVITAVEWVPGLRTGEIDYALLMILTLLACNTYQLLILHRLSGRKMEDKPVEGKEKSLGNAAPRKKKARRKQKGSR